METLARDDIRDRLRTFETFGDLPDDELTWLLDNGTLTAHADGEFVFRPGEPANVMAIVLEGGMRIRLHEGARRRMLPTVGLGGITGVLPYSRMVEFQGDGIAEGALQMLQVQRTSFPELVQRCPELIQRLVERMTDRVRSTAKLRQQQEKLSALGKLSAGLAHELNNPAAAIQRSADALRQQIDRLPERVCGLMAHGLGGEQWAAVGPILAATRSAQADETLSALVRGDREDAIGDWLEAHGHATPWALAEVLVEVGITVDDLEPLAAQLPRASLPAVLNWIEGTLSADRLLAEIASASGRISELVQAVKRYSHMDRSPARETVNVKIGLESTLTMLSHRIKRVDAEIRFQLPADLPPACALPGELNQVWTNLIDNALDAVASNADGQPRIITLHGHGEKDGVCVEIEDSGPGIPDDVCPNIFVPFYTTKGVGEGSGLGLDIVQRIVDQHGGSLSVETRPGRTVFSVWLPSSGPD
ncbi:MAG: ATP-binding protein [Acidobacteriota bacterium]